MADRVRITSVPPGEAPLWVRRAWVGLELPLTSKYGAPARVGVHGVMSGPRGTAARVLAILLGRFEHQRGYVVSAPAAVDVLELADPRAAKWWHESAPHMLQPGKFFVFEAGSGEIVADRDRA